MRPGVNEINLYEQIFYKQIEKFPVICYTVATERIADEMDLPKERKKLLKNRHLAKAIAQQKLYEFKRQIEYKCKMKGIPFIEADAWYPSSKKCSCCGNIKKALKLSERIYKCDSCGLEMDRDLNVSVNLANYQSV